jgi:hypothetical protein
MLFKTTQVATDRNGIIFREPTPGAKPDPATGRYSPEDMRPQTYGGIAISVLDVTLPSDNKAMQSAPDRWVKMVMRREETVQAIRAGMDSGDGWAELADDRRDLLVERLAEALTLPGLSNAMIGPVIGVLMNPPKEKSTEKAAA